MTKLTKPVFRRIHNLNKRRLAFLEYTAAKYNSENRAITNSGYEGNCVYYPTSKSDGCAIGCHLPKYKTQEMFGSVSNVLNYLPKWMKEMGIEFLSDMQDLHDIYVYWDTNGLTVNGKHRVARIKRSIENNSYNSN